MSRRQLLGGIGLAGGLLAAGATNPRDLLAAALTGTPDAVRTRPQVTGPASGAPRHLVWVWQLRHDGDPEAMRDTLASHGLGIILKTHDGTSWMSRYDPTPYAIEGPTSVAHWARFLSVIHALHMLWSLHKP